MATVVILHTSDIHGHLTAWTGCEGDLTDKTVGGSGRLAGAIAEARKEVKDALLLDAGDLLGDSMIAVGPFSTVKCAYDGNKGR